MGTLGVATGMAAVLFFLCRLFCPPLDLLRPDEDLPASSLELSLRESESSAVEGRDKKKHAVRRTKGQR